MKYDWSEVAFASKKELRDNLIVFIAAPRELSPKRLAQLIKTWLPKGNILFGLAKEDFVEGFDGQAHFKTLNSGALEKLQEKVNKNSPHKLITLEYFQRDLVSVLEKIKPKHAVFINGSWHRSFHLRPEFYALHRLKTSFQLVSPFADENEAMDYIENFTPCALPKGVVSKEKLIQSAELIAQNSFDWTYQVGAVLAKQTKDELKIISGAHNKVVPFETYSMHNGSVRESRYSPPGDLNHYDTVHAETLAIAQCKDSLKGAILAVNVMPCPPCARLIATTEISEVMYGHAHSDGYATKLLSKAGKKVSQI